MGTQRVRMKRLLSWLVHRACRASTGVFRSVLTALIGPVQTIFFLAVYYVNSFVPSPSKLGRQSWWVACLLLCVSDASWRRRGRVRVVNFDEEGLERAFFQSLIYAVCSIGIEGTLGAPCSFKSRAASKYCKMVWDRGCVLTKIFASFISDGSCGTVRIIDIHKNYNFVR